MLRTQLIIAAIAGWILINCLVVGAYQIFKAYQEWNLQAMNPEDFVKSLTIEERNILAETIMGYKEPMSARK